RRVVRLEPGAPLGGGGEEGGSFHPPNYEPSWPGLSRPPRDTDLPGSQLREPRAPFVRLRFWVAAGSRRYATRPGQAPKPSHDVQGERRNWALVPQRHAVLAHFGGGGVAAGVGLDGLVAAVVAGVGAHRPAELGQRRL